MIIECTLLCGEDNYTVFKDSSEGTVTTIYSSEGKTVGA
jgi:hypothetical protein